MSADGTTEHMKSIPFTPKQRNKKMETDLRKLFRQATVRGIVPGVRAEVEGRDCKVLAVVLREDRPTAEGLLVLYRFADTEEERLAPLARWPKTKPPKSDQSGRWSTRPSSGTGWKHFLGGEYGVITNAFLDTTGEHFVVYQAESDGTRWARTIESWQTPASTGVDRFVRIR